MSTTVCVTPEEMQLAEKVADIFEADDTAPDLALSVMVLVVSAMIMELSDDTDEVAEFVGEVSGRLKVVTDYMFISAVGTIQ